MSGHRSKDVDWIAAREDYVTGDMGYRELAKSYGITLKMLAQQAKNEGWVELRAQFRDRLRTETVVKAVEKVATERADRIARLQLAADGLSEAITKAFDDALQFNRHIVSFGKDKEFDTEERIYRKIDTKAIKDLTGALKDLTQVVRNVYDLPTLQEQEAMDIAKRRLKLDEDKAASADSGADEFAIRIEGGDAEDWSG